MKVDIRYVIIAMLCIVIAIMGCWIAFVGKTNRCVNRDKQDVVDSVPNIVYLEITSKGGVFHAYPKCTKSVRPVEIEEAVTYAGVCTKCFSDNALDTITKMMIEE